eukprot:s871_g5.t1
MAVRPRFRFFSALVQAFVWADVVRSHSFTEDACAVSTLCANLDAGDQPEESLLLLQHQGSLGTSAPNAFGLVQESPLTNRTIHTQGQWFSCTWTPSSCSRRVRGKQVLLLHGFPMWKESGGANVMFPEEGYGGNTQRVMSNLLSARLETLAPASGKLYQLGSSSPRSFLGWSLWRDGGLGAAGAASAYFHFFTRPSSASLANNTLYEFLGAPFAPSQTSMTLPGPGWESPEAFQRPLWWYNAIIPRWMAKGPLLSVPELAQLGFQQMAALLQLLGGGPTAGKAAENRAASISAPTLFICGNEDHAIPCTKPFSRATQQYCEGSYEFLEVKCGHDLQHCQDPNQTEIVTDAILDHIKKNMHWRYA